MKTRASLFFRLPAVMAASVALTGFVAAGLIDAGSPASAAAARITLSATGGRTSGVHHTPRIASSKNVDVKAFKRPDQPDGCGEFKGTIEAFVHVIGGNDENYFAVSGRLYERCSGKTGLTAYWDCGNSKQSHGLGSVSGGSKGIDWTSAQCSYPISGAHVTVCWTGLTGGGCSSSGGVSGAPPPKVEAIR